MNEQAELLLKWKDIVVGFLSEEWNAQEDGTAPEGDEYTRSLEVQANAEGYLNGMAALIADRRETMNAQRTLLAEIEHRDPNAKKRKTKTAAQADFIDETMEAVFAVQNPDEAVLQAQLNLARKGLRDAHTSKPLRVWGNAPCIMLNS
ncbi:hypothetical protein DL93DRAFT_1962270 [Clavulina sp. PMI_390]|nr:hypothetical protein DL93DRAFT_1962270 [Clavulina sp. PMI_390]